MFKDLETWLEYAGLRDSAQGRLKVLPVGYQAIAQVSARLS